MNRDTCAPGPGGLSTAITGTPSCTARESGSANSSGDSVKTATPSRLPFGTDLNIWTSRGPSTVGGPTTTCLTPPTWPAPVRKPSIISTAKLSWSLATTNETVGRPARAARAVGAPAGAPRPTAKVRDIDAVPAEWGQVFLDLGVENEALTDYLRAGSTIGRSPLISALDSAAPHLQWLTANGGPVDSGEVSEFRDTYGTYTDVLRQLIAAGNAGDAGQVSGLAQEVGLGAASLRKQVNANITRLQLVMSDYLARVDQANHRVRVAAT